MKDEASYVSSVPFRILFPDGCAIAHAVSNYLKDNTQCRTIFSTHYHELTREYSESPTEGVLIYHMDVMESPIEDKEVSVS